MCSGNRGRSGGRSAAQQRNWLEEHERGVIRLPNLTFGRDGIKFNILFTCALRRKRYNTEIAARVARFFSSAPGNGRTEPGSKPGSEGAGCVATCTLTMPPEQPNRWDLEPAAIPNFPWTGSLAGHPKKATIPLIGSPRAAASAQGSLLAGSVKCRFWAQFRTEPGRV